MRGFVGLIAFLSIAASGGLAAPTPNAVSALEAPRGVEAVKRGHSFLDFDDEDEEKKVKRGGSFLAFDDEDKKIKRGGSFLDFDDEDEEKKVKCGGSFLTSMTRIDIQVTQPSVNGIA